MMFEGLTNLSKSQEGTNYEVIKILNNLPTPIKSVANEIQVFKRVFLDNSFDFIHEYFF
jgi:hypothetical protein